MARDSAGRNRRARPTRTPPRTATPRRQYAEECVAWSLPSATPAASGGHRVCGGHSTCLRVEPPSSPRRMMEAHPGRGEGWSPRKGGFDGLLRDLFSSHVSRLQAKTEKALAEAGFDSLVISSGTPFTFFVDDRDAPFEPTPHFAHWCPLTGPHHLLHVVPGRRPKVVRYAPEDYWYEQGGVTEALLAAGVRPRRRGDPGRGLGADRHAGAGRVRRERGRPGRGAGLEANPEAARGPPRLEPQLQGRLRGRGASSRPPCIGARGHRAAREAFATGASEMEIHHAFVVAVGTTEAELPYTTIVALEKHGAILHYESKQTRAGRPGPPPRRGRAGATLRLRHHADDHRPLVRPALRGHGRAPWTPWSRTSSAPRPRGVPTSRSTSRPTGASGGSSASTAS